MSMPAKRTRNLSEKPVIVEEKLNERQACLRFRLTGTTREHVLKRYRAQSHSVVDWAYLFRRDRVIK